MGKLPETLALFALLVVIVEMSGILASHVQIWDDGLTHGPFHAFWSLESRRELAADPPGLLRDLREAGAGGWGFVALGVVLAAIAARAVFSRGRRRRRPRDGARARGVGLLALLLAAALSVPAFRVMTTTDLRSPFWANAAEYPVMAPGLAALRLGLAVAISGHVVALLAGLLHARRTTR